MNDFQVGVVCGVIAAIIVLGPLAFVMGAFSFAGWLDKEDRKNQR